jgi:peptidoglycan/LPS O-acetylase OafA/YrhL/lysophospholipase L1-like esterase
MPMGMHLDPEPSRDPDRSPHRARYRPDIDGLRAVAVLPVILFHAGWDAFGGGFTGVDVFFVISGYLITLQISGEIREGRFSIVSFYNRRVRRIFPALFAMVLGSLAIGSCLLLPGDFERLAESALGTAAFAANFHFWWTADYFDAERVNPLIHTWSLAVEEQFYLLFPPLLWSARRIFGARWAAAMLALLLASFAASAWAVRLEHPGAFYLPQFRAWELLLGALLALGTLPAVASRPAREAMGLTGLAMIAVAVASFSQHTPFPGPAALLPCLGAALVIHAGSSGSTRIGSLLALGPLVATGRISYSLYLWHWPLLEFARYFDVAPLSSARLAGVMATSVLVAGLSWRYVEQPFRRDACRDAIVFGSGALMTAAVGVLAGAILWTHGFPARLSEDALRYAGMLTKEQYFPIYDRGGCFLDYHQGVDDYDLDRCATSTARHRILVWGDSHAAHLYPGLREHLEAAGSRVYQYTATSCRPIADGNRRCDAFNAGFEKVLERLEPEVVVIGGSWPPTIARLGEEAFESELSTAIRRAKASGAEVIVAGASPTYAFAVPVLGFLHPELRTRDSASFRAQDHGAANRILRRVAAGERAAFHDFYGSCDGLDCPVFEAGQPLHWDCCHMTLAGSRRHTRALADLVLASTRRAAVAAASTTGGLRAGGEPAGWPGRAPRASRTSGRRGTR